MSRSGSLWSRHALALWFSGLGALGLLRFWLKLQRSGNAALTVDGWLWLGGALACLLVAAIAVLRSARNPRSAGY
jgi:hypothetical protein